MKTLLIFLALLSIPGSNLLNAQNTGCVSGDCVNGYGKFVYEDNSYYEGNFSNYARHGQGVFYAGGARFDGNWNNGLLDGEAACILPDGSTFKGMYRSNLKQGPGVLTYPNGTRMEGSWVDDFPAGILTVTLPSGEKYVGEMKDGKMHGRGTYYKADGTVYFDGQWENGKMVTGGANAATDSFCLVMKYLASAEVTDHNFKPIYGTLASEANFKSVYNVTMPLPGAKHTILVADLASATYIARYELFDEMEDAERQAEGLYQKLRTCFPDRMFYKVEPSGTLAWGIGFCKVYADGFDRICPRLSINNAHGYYQVEISIQNTFIVKNPRIYPITETGGSGDASFDSGLKTLMAAAPGNFNSLKGEKKTKGDFILQRKWYVSTFNLPGASGSEISTDDPGAQYSTELHRGRDSIEAVAAYEQLVKKVKSSLGSTYCYLLTEDHKSTLFALSAEWHKLFTPVLKIEFKRYSSTNFAIELTVNYEEFGDL